MAKPPARFNWRSSWTKVVQVLNWEGLSFVFLFTLAVTLLGMNEFVGARVAFIASGLVLAIRLVSWPFKVATRRTVQWGKAAGGLIIVVAFTWAMLHWVGKREYATLHARLEVTDVAFVNGSSFPSFNVFYTNRGAIGAKGFIKSYSVLASKADLDLSELLERQNKNDNRVPYQLLYDLNFDYREMSPNDKPNFFSVPGHPGEEAKTIADSTAGVLAQTVRLYVFISMIYRDDNLQLGTYGVTQYCFFYWGSLAVRHECGNRYVQKTFQELLAPATPDAKSHSKKDIPMPLLPVRPCSAPGCTAPVTGSMCDEHRRAKERAWTGGP